METQCHGYLQITICKNTHKWMRYCNTDFRHAQIVCIKLAFPYLLIICLLMYLFVSEQSQLEKMVGDLSMGLSVIKHEQEYMEVRERLHRMSK